VYTSNGEVRIHTDMMSAIYASKFPEYLHTYQAAYDGAFAALKEIRGHSARLSKLYGMLYSNMVELDVVNKEYLQIEEEDFNLLNMGQGFNKLGTFYQALGEGFYEHLRRNLTFAADQGKVSFRELWDNRQAFKERFLRQSD
jgi:hypothetical protein